MKMRRNAGRLIVSVCLVFVVTAVVCARLCAAVFDTRALILFTGEDNAGIREQWLTTIGVVFEHFKTKIGAKKIFAILMASPDDVARYCHGLSVEAGEVILSTAAIDKPLLLRRIATLAEGHNLMLLIFGHGNSGTIPFTRFSGAPCSANSFEEYMRQGLLDASTRDWPHAAPDQATLMHTIFYAADPHLDTCVAKRLNRFLDWGSESIAEYVAENMNIRPPVRAYAQWLGSIAYAGTHPEGVQYIRECGSVSLDASARGSVKLTGHDIIGLNKPWNNLLVFNNNCYGGGMFSLLSPDDLERNKIVNFAAAAPWHIANGSYFFFFFFKCLCACVRAYIHGVY